MRLSGALQADPRHRQSLALLARLEEAAGNAPAARRALSALVAAHPGDAHALLQWATLEAREGSARTARRLFRRGRDARPRDPALLRAWASLEARQGRVGQARCGARPPGPAPPRPPRSRAPGPARGAEGPGRPPPAPRRRLFRAAHEADPRHLPTLLGWASLEGRAGNRELSLRLHRDGLAVDPGNLPLRVSMAQCLAGGGDLGGAAEVLAACVADDPDAGKAWHELGNVARLSGDVAAARRHYRAGIRCSDRGHRLLCFEALGELECASGRREYAAQLFREGAESAGAPHLTSRYLRAWSSLEKRRGNLLEAHGLIVQASRPTGPPPTRGPPPG